MKSFIAVLIGMALMASQVLNAQPLPAFLAPEVAVDTVSHTRSFTLYFPLDKTALDPSYLQNPVQIKSMQDFFAKGLSLDSLTVVAWASPEGPLGHNEWLSRMRAQSARAFLRQMEDTPVAIRILPLGENWEGLRQQVVSYYITPNRTRVLAILGDKALSSAQRKSKLWAIDSGATYRFLIDTLMAPLRKADIEASWTTRPQRVKASVAAGFVAGPLQQLVRQPLRSPETKHGFTFALKTNLLEDAAPPLITR